MSKLYEHYKRCKEENSDKIILIRSGAFYVILDDDAKMLNEKLGLKLTMLNENIVKCGFPINSLLKYSNMLKANSLEFVITALDMSMKSLDKVEKGIINKIKNIDFDNLSPILAFNLLSQYKELLNKDYGGIKWVVIYKFIEIICY